MELLEGNGDWMALLSNDNGIRIDNGVEEQFRIETLSNIAKLMSRPNGRQLVHALLQEDNALTIDTPDPAQVQRMRDHF